MSTHKVDFPTHTRPSTDVSLMKLVGIAIVLTVALFGIVSLFKGTYVRELFMGRDKIYTDRVIFQGMTVLMFMLSLSNIVLKFRRLKIEGDVISEISSLVPEKLDFSDSNRLVQVYDQVKAHPRFTESIGLTRIARVLAMWINTENFDRTSQYAREEAELDAFASDSSYRANRLYIWAMPLLGFVGTVYGVSYGIGGFAEFLKGKDVTPELMKYHVSEITLGLAVAFYCTLLGLLTAGIAAFPSLRAERKEEGVLGEIEEFVEDRLISQMPSTQGETQIKFPIDELAKAIDLGFSRLPNPDKYEEVFSRAVTRAGDIINQKYSEFTTNYERKVGELGSQMGGKLEAVANSFNASTQRLAQQIGDQSQRLAQGLTDLESRQGQRLESLLEDMKELAQQMPEEFRKAQERYLHQQAETERKSAGSLEELAEQISEVGKEQAKQLGEAHERYLDAIADLDKKELARWEKMISDFNQMSVRLAEQFKQSVGTLDSATARYSERVQASTEGLAEQLGKVQALGTEIDKVLRTTQSVEGALRSVSGSDEFRQTLSNLRTHLATSDELLKQLSKPRKVVFQEARVSEE